MLLDTSLYEETDFCPSQESLESWTHTFKVLLHGFSKVTVVKAGKKAQTNCGDCMAKT